MPPGSSRKTIRNPVTLRQYALRYAVWSAVLWFVFLWWASREVHAWLASGGLVDHATTFLLTSWMGFFVGFVTTCTATLQPRRKLLVGRLEPTRLEWRSIETRPPATLARTFWLPAVLVAAAAGAGLGAVQLVLGQIGDLPGYPRRNFQFYTALLPALTGGLVAAAMARHSVGRFVTAMERGTPLRLTRRRYVLVHNVLPYAMFSSIAGLAAGMARFLPNLRTGREIPSDVVSLHIAITTLIIALLAVGASMLKTRTDYLSPILLEPPVKARIRLKWHPGYGLLVPLVVYSSLRLVLWALELEAVDAVTALGLKTGMCLVASVFITAWAVISTLQDAEQRGIDGHPYVQLHRILKDTGFLEPREIEMPEETKRT